MDWNQQAQPSRNLVTFSGTTSNILPTTHGPYFVGDLQSLAFFVLTNTANTAARIYFTWYTDQSLTTQLYQEEVLLRPGAATGDQATWTMPIYAPWLTVTVEPVLANVTYQLRLWSGPVNTPSYSISPTLANAARQIIFQADEATYPVGTTIIDGAVVFPGPAAFFAEVVTNLSSLTLYAVNYTNSTFLLCKHLASNGLNTKLVYLPPMHLRLVVRNLTAGAVTMSYSLTAKYGLL